MPILFSAIFLHCRGFLQISGPEWMLHESRRPWYEPSCRPRARDTLWWVVREPPATVRRPSHTNTQHNFIGLRGRSCPKSNPAKKKYEITPTSASSAGFKPSFVNFCALGNRLWNFTKKPCGVNPKPQITKKISRFFFPPCKVIVVSIFIKLSWFSTLQGGKKNRFWLKIY